MIRKWIVHHARRLSAVFVMGLSVFAWLSGIPLSSQAASVANVELHVRILNPPNAVTDMVASPVGAQNGDVQLSWTAPANANGAMIDHYFIRYATYPAPSVGQADTWWTQVSAGEILLSPAHAAGVTEFTTVSNLTLGVTFYFSVKSIDVDGQISPIDARTGTPTQAASLPLNIVGTSPPNTPNNFAGIALSTTSVQWTWTAAATASFYTLNDFPSGNLVIQTTNTVIVETGQTPNKSLSRTLRAANGFGLSSPTSAQTVYTLAAVPGAPNLGTVNYSTIGLTWTANANPAGTQYRLERSNDGTNFVSATLTTALSFTDTNLTQLTTYYYRLRAFNGDGVITSTTVAVSTMTPAQTDTLAPGIPMGLKGILDPTGTAFTLIWEAVTHNADGTPISNGDVAGYYVYRRSAIDGTATRVTPTPLTVTAFADQVNNQIYYYTIRAVDINGNESIDSLFADSSLEENVIFVATDTISSLVMPSSVNSLLRSNSNKYGVPLGIRMLEEPIPSNTSIIRQIKLQLVRSDTSQAINDLAFTQPEAVVVVGFNVANGQAVPGIPSLGYSGPQLSAGSSNQLSLFWNNGVTWIKVGGTVIGSNQTIQIKSSYLGSYQVRTAAAASALTLEQANIYPRLFTPNGDGFNDRVYFVLENPNNTGIMGQIFDFSGRYVATLPPPSANSGIGTSTFWDGKDSKGSVVPSGAYYYKIEGEGKTFTGTVGVAR